MGFCRTPRSLMNGVVNYFLSKVTRRQLFTFCILYMMEAKLYNILREVSFGVAINLAQTIDCNVIRLGEFALNSILYAATCPLISNCEINVYTRADKFFNLVLYISSRSKIGISDI